MKYLSPTLVVTLLLTTLLTLSHSQFTHIILSPDQSLIRHQEGFNQFLFFNFTVNNLEQNEDLLFTVSPLDWISNPDILISSVHQYPRFIEEAEYLCWNFGSDICPVPASQLSEQKTFYVSVYCRWSCSFAIQAHYEPQDILEINTPKTLLFHAENSADGHVLKLTIPEDFEGDHVLIQAIPMELETLNHSISLFINKGDATPNANSFMVQALPSWQGGVSFSFRKGMDFFCTGCVYTMLLTSKDTVGVEVLAKELTHEAKLEFKKRVYDFAFEDQVVQYLLEVNTSSLPRYKNRDINIELRPYTGNPDLYVNLNVRPKNFNDYDWVSNEFGIEALRISPEDRAEGKPTSDEIERYYIAVSGPRASTFSLMAYLDNKNRKPIDFGIAETGYVQQDQIETFMLEVPAQTENQSQISVTLHLLSGNPDLYIKSCPENFIDQQETSTDNETKVERCAITQDDINKFNSDTGDQQEEILDTDLFFIAGKSKSGNEQLMFLNGPPACTITTGDCVYAIAVHGNTQHDISSHYSVLASHNQVHTMLQEQVPIKNSLQVNEYQYYKFIVPDASNLLSVHFQLTPITGEAAIYSSKVIEFPTMENFEKTACFCAHIITYCGFNSMDIPLNATYYLAVYALSHTTYTITAITRSSLGPNVVQLMEGVPHRFVFPTTGPTQQQAYFRFRVDFSAEAPAEIHIHLTPLREGPFKILLSEGFLPDQEKAVWSSTSNKLSINSQDIQFVPSGNYFISVIPYDPADPTKTEFDTKNWQFTLQYYSSSTNLIELVEGHASIGRASFERPSFFRFAVNKDDTQVSVKLTQFGKPLQLYLSTDAENPYPSEEQNDLTGTSVVTLTKDDIKKFCYQEESGQVTGSRCPVFVSVYVTDERDFDQEFSITIEKPTTLITLQEGLPDSHQIIGDDWHVDYSIIPKKDQDINLSLVSKLPLKAYVTVIDTKEHPHITDWIPQESEENLVQDEEHHYIETRFAISTEKWAQYGESVVLIRLRKSEAEPEDSIDSAYFCTITSLGSMNRLMDSSVTFGRVQGGLYRFYKLETGNGDNKLLKIFLTPLTSGVPELFLQSDTIPVRGNYLYRSQDPSNPSITIENPKGEYYLSVYSPMNCSYSLVYTTHPETFLTINSGVPTSVVSSSTHEKGVYLIYRPINVYNPFKVLYSKESGDPELYVSAIEDDENRENQLPSAENHQYSSAEQGFISIAPQNGQPLSSQYMIFLKNDENTDENKATVMITENGGFAHLPSGKSFKDNVKQSELNHYYYISQDLAADEHVEISLIIYNGNPELYASTRPDADRNPKWKALQSSENQGSSIVLKILRENTLYDENAGTPANEERPALSLGQPLYIIVKGATESLYDIRINVGKRTASLDDGILTTGVIKGKEEKQFTFNSPYEDTEGKLITLVFTVISDDKKNAKIFPDIEIGYVPLVGAATMDDKQENDRFIEKHVEERRSQTSRMYRFVAKKALYLITLSTDMDIDITYSLSLNVKGLILLPPNNEMLAYLSEGDSDIYQVYIREPGNLLIQFSECFGNSTLSYTDSHEAYLNDQFSTTIQKPLQDNGYSLVEVHPGNVYLKVTALDGLVMYAPLAGEGHKKELESAYKIAVYFLPAGQKGPHQLVIPGNHGKVEAWKTGEGKYNVHWNNIQTLAADRQEKKNEEGNIYEMIYFSKSLRALNMAAKCQIIPGTEFVFTIEHNEDMSVWSFPATVDSKTKEFDKEIEIDSPSSDDSPFFVTVTARVQTSLQAGPATYSVPVAMFYEQTQAEGPSTISTVAEILKHHSWIIGVIGASALAVFGLLIWKCMRKSEVVGDIGRSERYQYELGRVQEEDSPADRSRYNESFEESPTQEHNQSME